MDSASLPLQLSVSQPILDGLLTGILPSPLKSPACVYIRPKWGHPCFLATEAFKTTQIGQNLFLPNSLFTVA